jgi:hypothetical protein
MAPETHHGIVEGKACLAMLDVAGMVIAGQRGNSSLEGRTFTIKQSRVIAARNLLVPLLKRVQGRH